MNKDKLLDVGDRVIVLNGSSVFKIPPGSVGIIYQIEGFPSDERFLIEMEDNHKYRWLLREREKLHKI